jgi:hypothetical protein
VIFGTARCCCFVVEESVKGVDGGGIDEKGIGLVEREEEDVCATVRGRSRRFFVFCSLRSSFTSDIVQRCFERESHFLFVRSNARLRF